MADRLILASSSPRRAALLRAAGYVFEVVSPPDDEPMSLSTNPRPVDHARALSRFKAESVQKAVDGGVLLAADTVVAVCQRIFGKPVDRLDARRILQSLAGTTHEVITGVTLLDVCSGRLETMHDRTLVTMKSWTEKEMTSYLDSDAWIGKAGAYGIQDHGDQFVTHLEGSFTNVVGLPMELVAGLLGDRFQIKP